MHLGQTSGSLADPSGPDLTSPNLFLPPIKQNRKPVEPDFRVAFPVFPTCEIFLDVARLAVDLAVGAFHAVGCVEDVSALAATEAVLMEHPRPRENLLSLENLTSAARTRRRVGFV